MITAADADTFARCIHVHGVALFPADTVYGIACDPDADAAVKRLYRLNGRPPDKPAAVMFFRRDGLVSSTVTPPGSRRSSAARVRRPRSGSAASARSRRKNITAAGLSGGLPLRR